MIAAQPGTLAAKLLSLLADATPVELAQIEALAFRLITEGNAALAAVQIVRQDRGTRAEKAEGRGFRHRRTILRRQIAEIIEQRPLSVTCLMRATGVKYVRVYDATRECPWFEMKEGLVSLTEIGRRELLGVS